VTPTTTIAPTTTTSTTTTTEEPASTAPSTAPPATSTPTTTPAANPPPTSSPTPDALPFAQLVAVDDAIGTAEQQLVLDVLDNDTFTGPVTIEVSEASIGSVEVQGTSIVADLPASFGGEMRFTYTVRDSAGNESSADVTIFSANVLTPANDAIDPEPEVTSISEFFDSAGTFFTGLVKIRLSTVQLGVLALAPLVFGVLRWLFVRREDLLSITNSPRARSVSVGTDTGRFNLRHDALMWSTGKTRHLPDGKSKTQVELPDGSVSWIDSHRVVDTGY